MNITSEKRGKLFLKGQSQFKLPLINGLYVA